MASSENLASIEPWMYRPAFADSWISEAFARDTETLTKALQKSLSNNYSDVSFAAMDNPISPFFNLVNPDVTPVATATQSGSGSDRETPTPRRRSAIPVNGGKATKRKSRASKRTTTTFITADPANFRQMVQQVTGIRFSGNGQLPVSPVLKPEPYRAVNRMQGCLPTLDTSAFLLDHQQQQQQQMMAPPSTAEMVTAQPCSATVPPTSLVADGGSSFDFEAFSCFPTLESWKVM